MTLNPSSVSRGPKEYQAGKTFADVFDGPGVETDTAQLAGVLGRYLSPERQAYAPSSLDAQDYSSAFREKPVVTRFNTDLRTTPEVPTTLAGLSRPLLKSKLGMPVPAGPEYGFSAWRR